MKMLTDLKEITRKNDNFRKVVLTGKKSQLVLMQLRPGEEIGEETHPDIDQMFFIQGGQAELIVDGRATLLEEHDVALVLAGERHNLRNSSKKALKLYTIYAPPAHEATEIQKTNPEAAHKAY